jgi:toxin FitB
MYLADTNVISHGVPKPRPAEDAFTAWLRRNGAHLWVSTVTLAEISFGAANLGRRGATSRADAYRRWIGQVLALQGERVLPVDSATALRAGELLARAIGEGRQPGLEDAMIAATAEQRGLIVLTRNVGDFAALGVDLIDPFTALPPDLG